MFNRITNAIRYLVTGEIPLPADHRPIDTDMFLCALIATDSHGDFPFRFAVEDWLNGDWESALDYVDAVEMPPAAQRYLESRRPTEMAEMSRVEKEAYYAGIFVEPNSLLDFKMKDAPKTKPTVACWNCGGLRFDDGDVCTSCGSSQDDPEIEETSAPEKCIFCHGEVHGGFCHDCGQSQEEDDEDEYASEDGGSK